MSVLIGALTVIAIIVAVLMALVLAFVFLFLVDCIRDIFDW